MQQDMSGLTPGEFYIYHIEPHLVVGQKVEGLRTVKPWSVRYPLLVWAIPLVAIFIRLLWS